LLSLYLNIAMFGHHLHKTKHGTSPVIHGDEEVVHASTDTVVLATPEVVAPTPSMAVPSKLEMAESPPVAGRPMAPIPGLAAILGVVEASKCLEVPASTNISPLWLRRWSLSWPLYPSLCLRAIFYNKKRVAMELKCSDSVTWGGRKAGKFISGPSRVVISCKWMKC
jgi:hypothetical protein